MSKQEEERESENQRDSGLIEKIKKGNILAFSQLFNFHYQKLYAYNYSRIHNRQDAEDIVQEVFTAFDKTLKEGKYLGNNFGGWLCTTASHFIIDLFRKKKHYKIEELEPELPFAIMEEEFGDIIITEENMAKLEKAMLALSSKNIDLLRLWYWDEKSYKEIGIALNLKEKSASSMRTAIIKRLKKSMTKK